MVAKAFDVEAIVGGGEGDGGGAQGDGGGGAGTVGVGGFDIDDGAEVGEVKVVHAARTSSNLGPWEVGLVTTS
eukprot:3619055-Prymnesium_polylepis.2